MTKRELVAQLKELQQRSLVEMKSTAEHYGLPELHDRHMEKLQKVLTAQTYEEGEALAKRATDSVFLTCLSAWSSKRIPGPRTPEILEKKAKQADSLAKFQESRGNDKDAAKQKDRAERLRNEAGVLRGTKPAPRGAKHLRVRSAKAKEVSASVVRRAAKAFKAVRTTRRLFRTF